MPMQSSRRLEEGGSELDAQPSRSIRKQIGFEITASATSKPLPFPQPTGSAHHDESSPSKNGPNPPPVRRSNSLEAKEIKNTLSPRGLFPWNKKTPPKVPSQAVAPSRSLAQGFPAAVGTFASKFTKKPHCTDSPANEDDQLRRHSDSSRVPKSFSLDPKPTENHLSPLTPPRKADFSSKVKPGETVFGSEESQKGAVIAPGGSLTDTNDWKVSTKNWADMTDEEEDSFDASATTLATSTDLSAFTIFQKNSQDSDLRGSDDSQRSTGYETSPETSHRTSGMSHERPENRGQQINNARQASQRPQTELLTPSRALNAFQGFMDGCEASSGNFAWNTEAYAPFGKVEVVGSLHSSNNVRRMVKSVADGLKLWKQPEAAHEGMGGCYFFMNDKGEKQAIVKPCDEEPFAPNNPKGFIGKQIGDPGIKPSVRVGEAAMREVAAFILDHKGFAKVPATVLVRVTHSCFHVAPEKSRMPVMPDASSSNGLASSLLSDSLAAASAKPTPTKSQAPRKLASMQEFVYHQQDCNDIGPSRFIASDIHRIGILDLRIFNTDRHAGNILVNPVKYSNASHPWMTTQLKLIPIDHGFCLPEALEPPYFEWLHWPQAKVPFDATELEYIENLDADSDVSLLQEELPWIPEGSLRVFQVATMLLKECAAGGLTLFEIASLASRPIVGFEEEPSQLEEVCMMARRQVDLGLISQDSLDTTMGAIPESDESEVEGEDGTLGGDGFDDLGMLGEHTSEIMGHKVSVHTPAHDEDMMFGMDVESSKGSGTYGNSRLPSSSPESSPLGSSRLRGLGLHTMASGKLRSQWSAVMEESADLARSHIAGLHPKAHAMDRQRRIKTGMEGYRQRNAPGRRAQPFQPPIVHATLEEVSGALDGLDDAGWKKFMQALHVEIAAALRSGNWVQSSETRTAQGVGLGVSCPAF